MRETCQLPINVVKDCTHMRTLPFKRPRGWPAEKDGRVHSRKLRIFEQCPLLLALPLEIVRFLELETYERILFERAGVAPGQLGTSGFFLDAWIHLASCGFRLGSLGLGRLGLSTPNHFRSAASTANIESDILPTEVVAHIDVEVASHVAEAWEPTARSKVAEITEIRRRRKSDVASAWATHGYGLGLDARWAISVRHVRADSARFVHVRHDWFNVVILSE